MGIVGFWFLVGLASFFLSLRTRRRGALVLLCVVSWVALVVQIVHLASL